MYEEIELEEFAPWLVIVIALIGGFLRAFQLGAKGMWLDETFSVWLASQSVSEMLQWIVRIDQHPPLYYLLLHYWIASYGDTADTVRLLSVLFGAGTIPIIYLIGKRISGAVLGLAAAVLLTLSPIHIYYAQETRMYTLLTFNAAAAMYALVRLLTDGRSVQPIGNQLREYVRIWGTAGLVKSDSKADFSYQVEHPQTGWRAWIDRHRWPPIQTIETDLAWLALIVFSAATLLSHNTAVFYFAATNLFVLGLLLFQRIKNTEAQPAFLAPSLANWVKAQVGTLLLWSPWMIVFIEQASRVSQEFWIPQPTWEIISQTFRSLINASAPGQKYQVIVTWSLSVALGLGLVYFRKKLSIFLFLAALVAVPFLGELIVSIHRPIFFDRYLIWITIPMFLLLAAGILLLRFRLLMVVALSVFATNYLFSTGDYFRFCNCSGIKPVEH